MLYLDIGANGKENEDKIYSYSITSVNDMQAYPLGVDFTISAATGDGGDSIAVFIIPTSDGSVTFTPSGNSIAVGGTTTTVQELDEEDQPVTKTYSISHYSYHNLGCSVTAATGGAPPQPVNTEPIYSRTTYITVLSFNDNTKAYDIYYYFKVVDENISSTGALIANTTETTYYIGTKLQSGEIEYEEALWESEGEEVGITEIVTSLAAEGFLDELRTRDIVAIIAKLTGKTIFDSTLPDMPWAVGTTTNPYDPEDDTWLDEDSIQYVITVSSSGTITILQTAL